MLSEENVMLSEAERSRSISLASLQYRLITTTREMLRLRSASLSMTFCIFEN